MVDQMRQLRASLTLLPDILGIEYLHLRFLDFEELVIPDECINITWSICKPCPHVLLMLYLVFQSITVPYKIDVFKFLKSLLWTMSNKFWTFGGLHVFAFSCLYIVRLRSMNANCIGISASYFYIIFPFLTLFSEKIMITLWRFNIGALF